MLNLRYEIALPQGVNLHPRQEHALSVAVDMVRAALAVSTATLRAALSVGVTLRYGKSCSIRVYCHAESMLSAWEAWE